MTRVISVGCRLNQTEGENLVNLNPSDIITNTPLAVDYQTEPNFVIINTCAVTKEAVSTSWKMIRRQIKSSKVQRSKVIVTGCLATLEKEKMLQTPGIDAVITQAEKIKLMENTRPIALHITRSRPMIKIQDGCPNECSYCIARIIRGRPKSIVPELIIDEINKLINLGYQEIVLTGLNLGYYGQEINWSLTKLLVMLPKGDYRIRLSSIEPDTVTDELLDICQQLMAAGKLCRHLHIPLQSGDERILQKMRRRYSVAEYRNLIEKIDQQTPQINIGTDVIVGFPEEDENAFDNTLKLINDLPFGYLHIFPYSPRPLTEAFSFYDDVAPEIKKKRVNILRQVRAEKIQAFRKRFLGQTLDVLAEENCSGVTDNYIRIDLPKEKNYQKGRLYKITV